MLENKVKKFNNIEVHLSYKLLAGKTTISNNKVFR